MNKYKVLHIVNSLYLSAGGPSRTVVSLCDALADNHSLQISLLTQKTRRGGLVKKSKDQVNRIDCSSNSSLSIKLGLPIRDYLKSFEQKNQLSIIHNHGIWMPSNHWASRFAKKNNIPLVIHPRGMLEPWAINNKSIKKILAMNLYQRSDFLNANLIVATSEQEYLNIRKLGLKNTVAIIPNGINMPNFEKLESKSPKPNSPKRALFLSRLHPKKGLLNLIHAWKKVKPKNWVLDIVGPDEENHLKEIKKLALRLGMEGVINFYDESYGRKKEKFYRDSNLFVLPTFSENFGIVVAEAMSYGLPVITTKGAPWRDIEKFNCGWWVDIGIDPLAKALNEATSMSDDLMAEMGDNAKKYVKIYDWKSISLDMKLAYDYILGKIDKPNNIYEN